MRGGITLAIYIAIGLIPVCLRPAAVGQQSALSRQSAATAASPIVITWGSGGVIREHHLKYTEYSTAGKTVEIRGPCYSACTLVTAYFSKDKLCIGQGAFFAFHAARSSKTHETMPYETEHMYWEQPTHIRDWIDHNGGWQNLPLNGYWTMYDHELWAMGYPKCN